MSLTKIGDQHFNITRILKHVEGAARELRGSERTLVELVARLIRVQQQRIKEMEARIVFLERDALAADRDHAGRREAFAALLSQHEDLSRRYDLIMQREHDHG
jgi:uncharacterized protein YigA (DUF484 family)